MAVSTRTGGAGVTDAASSDVADVTPAGAGAPLGAARFREGAGRLSLDFVRTLRRREMPDSVEELPDQEALLAWVDQCGPCTVETGMVRGSAAQVGDARSLREAILELITAGRGPDGVASSSFLSRELVNRAAAVPVPTPRVDAVGGRVWTAADPVAATLSLVARDAIDLVASGAVERVRECADPSCSALFHDNSRPGNRRWCSMGACGNRAKKNTIRSRSGPAGGRGPGG